MACARTVAVVVPSPATSEVLEATSRTICAPMFSRPSFNSISFATVTPSLVMVGDPNFFSITTLRPLGPRVTFTASARILTPRRIACRDSSPCTICFAIIRISYQKLRIFLQATPAECLGLHAVRLLATGQTPDHYRRAPTVSFLATPDRTPRTSSSFIIRKSSPSILISVPAYLANRMWSPSFTARGNTLPSSLLLPLPTEMTSPSCGLSLALSGMRIPPRVVPASSTRRTRMRSCSGVNFVAILADSLSFRIQSYKRERYGSCRTMGAAQTALHQVCKNEKAPSPSLICHHARLVTVKNVSADVKHFRTYI